MPSVSSVPKVMHLEANFSKAVGINEDDRQFEAPVQSSLQLASLSSNPFMTYSKKSLPLLKGNQQ